jgi:hypothetical protein
LVGVWNRVRKWLGFLEEISRQKTFAGVLGL